MRKLETREDTERRERRNKIIIGIVLTAIMLFSTIGYAFFSGNKNTEEKIKASYNGRDFFMQGNYWVTEINGNQFYFSYLPNETRSISLKKTIDDYVNKPLYYTGESPAMQEILSNLASSTGKNPQKACFQDENCTENIPFKNCSSNLIIIKEQDIGINPIREEENCIFIFSNDTVRDADAFLYKILGIK